MLSLTKEQFRERLEERAYLLQLALIYAVQHTEISTTFEHGDPNKIDIYISKTLQPLFFKTVVKMLDLIYNEEE